MGRSPRGPSALALEELHRALVLFGRGARLERPQVPAPAGFGIELARIEPVLTGSELSDHPGNPPNGFRCSPLDPGAPRRNDCNSSKPIVSLSLPHYLAAPQQVTHVRDHDRVEDERAELERRKAAAQLIDLHRDVNPAAQRGDPFAPAAREP